MHHQDQHQESKSSCPSTGRLLWFCASVASSVAKWTPRKATENPTVPARLFRSLRPPRPLLLAGRLQFYSIIIIIIALVDWTNRLIREMMTFFVTCVLINQMPRNAAHEWNVCANSSSLSCVYCTMRASIAQWLAFQNVTGGPTGITNLMLFSPALPCPALPWSVFSFRQVASLPRLF